MCNLKDEQNRYEETQRLIDNLKKKIAEANSSETMMSEETTLIEEETKKVREEVDKEQNG